MALINVAIWRNIIHQASGLNSQSGFAAAGGSGEQEVEQLEEAPGSLNFTLLYFTPVTSWEPHMALQVTSF